MGDMAVPALWRHHDRHDEDTARRRHHSRSHSHSHSTRTHTRSHSGQPQPARIVGVLQLLNVSEEDLGAFMSVARRSFAAQGEPATANANTNANANANAKPHANHRDGDSQPLGAAPAQLCSSLARVLTACEAKDVAREDMRGLRRQVKQVRVVVVVVVVVVCDVSARVCVWFCVDFVVVGWGAFVCVYVGCFSPLSPTPPAGHTFVQPI